MDRRGTDATLLAMPLAGWDAEFLDTIRDRGGWTLLDGIAEHAGRGNYVPDYDDGKWNFLGQVRTAWKAAQSEGAARSTLNLLFRSAVAAGKRARTETGIGRGTASISHAAASSNSLLG